MEDWGERLQEKNKANKSLDMEKKDAMLEEFERFRKESNSRKQSNVELIIELLKNPRVESISINYTRVGEVENADIKAELKEVD